MHLGRWFVAALLVAAAAIAVYAAALDDIGRRSGGRLLWKADAERPLAQEWASSAAMPASGPCDSIAPPDASSPRIRRSRIAAQGRYSYAITLEHGDDCHGERAELGQGNPSRAGFDDRVFEVGEERWISFQVRLGRDFDPTVDAWRVIMQLHQRGDGSPPISLDVENGRWILYRSQSPSNDSVNSTELWSAPARVGQWVKFTLHVRFSPTPDDGFVALWGDPAGGRVVSLLPETAMHTMKQGALPLHSRIGIYRNPAGPFGTETVLYDGYTVATTRAAAEGNAFAPAAAGAR